MSPIATQPPPSRYAPPSHPPLVRELADGMRVSADLFYALPNKGFELVDGRVRENEVSLFTSTFQFFLLGLIFESVRQCLHLGHPSEAEGGFRCFADPNAVRKPDFAWIGKDRMPSQVPPTGYPQVAPHFVVEVRSPSDRGEDLSEKVAAYLAAGVEMVWAIDPESLTAVVHTAAGAERFGAETPLPCPHLPPLRLTLRQVATLVEASETTDAPAEPHDDAVDLETP